MDPLTLAAILDGSAPENKAHAALCLSTWGSVLCAADAKLKDHQASRNHLPRRELARHVGYIGELETAMGLLRTWYTELA